MLSAPHWDRIKEVFQQALDRPPHERAAWLHEVCGDDRALLAEVQSLLTTHDEAGSFAERPAIELLGQLGLDEAGRPIGSVSRMIHPGDRFGVYEIEALLGAGGMGEVYRARDTELGRDVAIKVLPAAFVTDRERLARFEREARLLAAVNHPNVGAIYGIEHVDGVRALVLELVEGLTLAERLARDTTIPISEALPIAKQIADALEAAHEKGIVHRDLKPANVKITPAGVVKVLDFGLAKAGGDISRPELSQSPTLTVGRTQLGMPLGTAAYMSPEQARGQPVDKRTDIWAFGCVLYEMLTGRPAFSDSTLSDTLAAILNRDPDWTALSPSTPSAIRRLLLRCLEKDRHQRLSDIADARLEINDALSDRGLDRLLVASARPRQAWLAWTAVPLVAMATGAMVWALRPAPTAPEMRVEITTPQTTDPVSLAISPDGSKLVFAATAEGRSQLWLRSLDDLSSRPLPGTDDARFPFWSPDSRSIAFFAEGQLKRFDLDTSAATRLADSVNGSGGTWGSSSTILFAPIAAGPIARISANGGEPAAVTRVVVPGQSGHRFPLFLPDGRHFLYYVAGTPEVRGVYVAQLDGSEARQVLDAETAAVYSSSGQLLFVRQGELLGQDFDPVRCALRGNPFPVAEHVAVDSIALPAVSASARGPIVYRTASVNFGRRLLTWVDRSGHELGRWAIPTMISRPRCHAMIVTLPCREG